MTPSLFDQKAVAQNRNRARTAQKQALFLHDLVAQQVSERLNEVNKRFTDQAVVTAFPSVWQAVLPKATYVSEADTLDLTPAAQDLIVHALSMHWSNDPVGQMIQCRRALRADGLFLAVMFGGRSLQELRACLAEAESRLKGGLSPRIAPMAELRDLGGLLSRAGLALPVADSDLLSVTYPDMAALMHDLRAMGETNALTARPKGMTGRALFDLAAEIYQENYCNADNRLTATVEMIFLTGWAPSDTQQKPLRPGSAQTRLAAALGVEEQSANVSKVNNPQGKAEP
jgi:SAM-dependent methyltransferase